MLIRPSLLKKLIDKVLDTEAWIDWEPETLAMELNSSGVAEVAQYKKAEVFTNVVDAIRAILSKDSMALMEWHLFENVCVTFSGNAPDFFETTPPATHELYFAIRFLEDFFPDLEEELSDETMMYIGSLFLSEGIHVHIHQLINNAIDLCAKLNNLDIAEAKTEQAAVLKELGSNKKLISALSTSVVSGGEGLSVSDKASPESRRALQVLTSYLFLEHILSTEDAALKSFLEESLRSLPGPVVASVDAARASTTDEHITDLDDNDSDDYIANLISMDDASTGGADGGTELEATATKAAAAKAAKTKPTKAAASMPGLAGFNYHAGQLYEVKNEIGRDDVPKSKLRNSGANGDAILKGNNTTEFTSGGENLTIIGKDKDKKPNKIHTSPTDSSLELAGI